MLTPSLLAEARAAAATVIQAQQRRHAATQKLRAARRARLSTALAAHQDVLGQRTRCTVDTLSRTLDNIVFADKRTPFLRAGSDDAYAQINRALSFSPGFTLKLPSDAEKLGSTLIEAMKAGVNLILELEDSTSLAPIFEQHRIPFELLTHPRRIYDDDDARSRLLGPLLGCVDALAVREVRAADGERSGGRARRPLARGAEPHRAAGGRAGPRALPATARPRHRAYGADLSRTLRRCEARAQVAAVL